MASDTEYYEPTTTTAIMRMSRDWMDLGEDDVGILEEATPVAARHGQDEDD
jgi:hypothetical protein